MLSKPDPNVEVEYPKYIQETENGVILDLKVNWMSPDRTTYKKYSPSFDTSSILVRVIVPHHMVYEVHTEGIPYVVLTPAGLAEIADQLADAFDRMNDEFLKRV